MKRLRTFAIAISLGLAAVVATTIPSSAQTPKSGGHLNLMQREDLSQGFAVHESKGVYRPARGLEELTAAAEQASPLHQDLEGTVEELFLRTRKRSYLGVVRGGRIEIVAFRGRQGVPRMPGLGSEIRDSAHALAMGKVVLALLEPGAVARYVARGLKSFTPTTITTPEALAAELEAVRRNGFAVDREEFDENFCCVAAPILDEQGRFAAALGLSTTPHVFDIERDVLAATVVDVTRGAAGAALRQVHHIGFERRPGRLVPVS